MALTTFELPPKEQWQRITSIIALHGYKKGEFIREALDYYSRIMANKTKTNLLQYMPDNVRNPKPTDPFNIDQYDDYINDKTTFKEVEQFSRKLVTLLRSKKAMLELGKL